MNIRLTLLAASAVLAATSASAQVVYDNLSAPSALSAATSSTDLNTIYGDSMTLTQGGILNGLGFTVFNSSTGNTLPVLTAVIRLSFYNNTTPYTTGDLQSVLPLLGSIDFNVNFGTGLNAGFFTTVSGTGLATANINLTQNLFITQQVISSTGGSTRLGVVSFTQDVVGTGSAASWYRQSTAPAGEGLFAFAPPSSNNLGYRVEVVPEPATMTLLALGALAARRRRKNS